MNNNQFLFLFSLFIFFFLFNYVFPFRSGIALSPAKCKCILRIGINQYATKSFLKFTQAHWLIFVLAYGNLANVFVRQKKFKEAEDAYRSALRFRYNMADTHYNL